MATRNTYYNATRYKLAASSITQFSINNEHQLYFLSRILISPQSGGSAHVRHGTVYKLALTRE